MPVVVRPFRPADVPALVALFRDTVRRVNRRDYTDEQVRAWAPDDVDPARWALMADRFAVVAEDSGRVVGFADLDASGYVDRLFVHADRQRAGVGRAIMEELLRHAAAAGLPPLHAAVSVTARPFFERFGFVVVAEQEVTVRGVALKNFRMERPAPTR